MGSADGRVVGTTKILDSGADGDRYNIVILADGYTEAQQGAFNAACNEFVTALAAEPWFDTLIDVINVHRVNVASHESGADDPTACSGTGATPRTYFDASFCTDDDIRRSLWIDASLVRATCDAQVPAWQVVIVLVNAAMSGGKAWGPICTASAAGDWTTTMLHELGHAAFDLADEYPYRKGCGTDVGLDVAPASEPIEPNVTVARTRETLKWAALVGPETPLPTTLNPDCRTCDDRPLAGVDPDLIGLFEGAKYYHCGRFRPAYRCKMRSGGLPFCRVCVEAIHAKLQPYVGDVPRLGVARTSLDFGSLARGSTRIRTVEIKNFGTVEVTGVTAATGPPGFTASFDGSTTLAPNESRQVSITFGPLTAEGPHADVCYLTSNAATVAIALYGVGCPAQLDGRVVAQDYAFTMDFGEVAHGLTARRWFDVQNRRVDCPGALRVTLSAPTGGFGYAPGTELAFSLAEPEEGLTFTARRVLVEFTAPESGGPDFAGQFTVEMPDSVSQPTREIQLRARAVPPPPVDSVLAIERSTALEPVIGDAGRRRIDAAIGMARFHVAALAAGDRIGVVRFNDDASAAAGDVLLDLTAAGPGAGVAGALARGGFPPEGGTSVGAGLLLASELLSAQAVAARRALVLVASGRQDTAPAIADAQATLWAASPPQRVIGLSFGLDQLGATLAELAVSTGGVAHVTGDLAGVDEFRPEKLLLQAMADLRGDAFVSYERVALDPGAPHGSDLWFGSYDVAADVLIVFRYNAVHPKYARLWLEAPDGTLTTADDVAAGVAPGVRTAETVVYRLAFPIDPARPPAHVGRWRVWVENFSNNGPIRAESLLLEGLPCFYAVMAKTRSNFRLDGRLDQMGFAPGTTFTVSIEPRLFGQPAALEARPEVWFRRPDGTVGSATAQQTWTGAWFASFSDTGLAGTYRAEVAVALTGPDGVRLTRSRDFTGVITG